MRIGIDARLALHEPHGMGKYILHLAHELARLDTENSYILYTDREDIGAMLPDRFPVNVLGSRNYFIWEQILLPNAVKKDGVDLLHCPANTAPVRLSTGTVLVMTIHDVMYLHNGDETLEPGNWHQRAGSFYRRVIVPRAAANAALIMTDSLFSKNEIHRYIGLNETQVEVVYLGCEFSTSEESDIVALRHRHGIPESYVLSFGGIAPRKNTNGMLRAFSLLRKRMPIQLVVTAIPRSANNDFMDYARSLGIHESVVFLEFLPEEDLHTLMKHSSVFLFLSKFEGFGLPVVESMKCGVPIVASNVTSIPEIAGDGAFLVSPDNEEDAANAMLKILTNAQSREALVKKGFERSKEFSWTATAEHVMQCYHQAVVQGG